MTPVDPTDVRQAHPKQVNDPTENVLGVIGAAVGRLNDLRIADNERLRCEMEAERRRINEQMALRAESNQKLSEAESRRLDAIRTVDVNAVSIANERATAQAVVLANQVATSAETLRTLVASTANTQAQQLATLTSQLIDRIQALEKSQYESKNLSGSIPPAVLDRLAQLEESRYKNEGRAGNSKDTFGWIVGAIMTLIAIASFLLPRLK